jgi:hypothetical protein
VFEEIVHEVQQEYLHLLSEWEDCWYYFREVIKVLLTMIILVAVCCAYWDSKYDASNKLYYMLHSKGER